MSRVVKEYDERRLDFLEATKLFFFSIGYEKMSVQMLTKKVGVAKGTFYHYFKSKEDLLSQWVVHEMGPIIESHYEIADDPNLDAITKLSAILKNDRDWTIEHMDFTLALLKVMYHDNNIRLRTEMSRQSAKLSQPLLEKVIIQGVEEGCFDTHYPKEVSRKLPRLFDLYGEDLARAVLNQQKGTDISYEEVKKTVHVWQEVIERILGAESKSIIFIDDTLLEEVLCRVKEESSAVITSANNLPLESILTS